MSSSLLCASFVPLSIGVLHSHFNKFLDSAVKVGDTGLVSYTNTDQRLELINSTVEIIKCVFRNHVGQSGGAIMIMCESLSVGFKEVSFINCSAGLLGGGFCITSSHFVARNVFLIGCSAGIHHGNAIYMQVYESSFMSWLSVIDCPDSSASKTANDEVTIVRSTCAITNANSSRSVQPDSAGFGFYDLFNPSSLKFFVTNEHKVGKVLMFRGKSSSMTVSFMNCFNNTEKTGLIHSNDANPVFWSCLFTSISKMTPLTSGTRGSITFTNCYQIDGSMVCGVAAKNEDCGHYWPRCTLHKLPTISVHLQDPKQKFAPAKGLIDETTVFSHILLLVSSSAWEPH